ncbi:hypothetical protein KI387_044259 [Taxus chinensis]|uniref:Uncharacterized protein n=1 Tax=Taxus chinensis TaxID=29808 RepID=A0AA38F8P3_TAXCH|nr:hypothetical protein KI387_044259 [Taxus chinensis]
MRVLPTYNPDTDTLEYMYVVPKVVKPENEMLPTDYDVTSLQMDLKEMKPSEKINVSKRNNDVVYTTLLKAERENNKLNNKIQKLEVDLENEKAKGKVVVNKTGELERKIKSSTSMTAVALNEQAQVELEDVKKNLQETTSKNNRLQKTLGELKEVVKEEKEKVKKWEQSLGIGERKKEIESSNIKLSGFHKKALINMTDNVWGKINQKIDDLIRLFEFMTDLQRIFDKLHEYVTGSRKVMALREDTTKKILEAIYKFSDTELASRGIQNRFDASIKVSSIIQKCVMLGEAHELLNKCQRMLQELHGKVHEFTNLGFPMPFDNTCQFIKKDAFQKKMKEKMTQEKDQIPEKLDEKKKIDSVKPLITLSVSLHSTVKESSTISYELLTKLHVSHSDLQQISIPTDEEWSMLQKMI